MGAIFPHRRSAKILQDIREVVENVVGTMPKEMIGSAANNLAKRVKLCIAKEGGHFEQRL